MGKKPGDSYQVVCFCPNCIQDVLDSEIEFTVPTILNEVAVIDGCYDNCDNVDPDNYSEKVSRRGTIFLED